LKTEPKTFNFGSFKLGGKPQELNTEPKTKFNFAVKAETTTNKNEK
jgi:hypothetical protein